MMLDSLGTDHPVKRIAVVAFEASGAHHRFRLQRENFEPQAILDIRNQIAFKFDSFG